MNNVITSQGSRGPARHRSSMRVRSRRAERGGAMVEFAIMAPILIALILWSNYFLEVQLARIKAAEVARYVGFERTVRKDISAIASEAKQRYQDLNGATKTGTTAMGFTNQFTLTITGKNAAAPISGSLSSAGSQGGLGGLMGTVTNLVGNSVEAIIGLLGFKMDQGAVQANVELKVTNRILPAKIVDYVAGGADKLDLTFKDSFFVYHDTWRAWDNGLNPLNSYPGVEEKTYERVKKVAYLGLADAAGVGDVLSAIGKVMDLLKLDFPFSNSYIRDMMYIKKVGVNGRYNQANRPTRTVPGDKLQANYWKNDWWGCWGSCESSEIKNKRGITSNGGYGDNWPMRAYNCRGKFFQGAAKSDKPESEYAQSASVGKSHFNYASNACKD